MSGPRISGPGAAVGVLTPTPRDTGPGVHAHDVSRMAVAARSILCHPKRLRRPRSRVINLSERRHGQSAAAVHPAHAGQTRTSPSGRVHSNTWLQTCSSFEFAASSGTCHDRFWKVSGRRVQGRRGCDYTVNCSPYWWTSSWAEKVYQRWSRVERAPRFKTNSMLSWRTWIWIGDQLLSRRSHSDVLPLARSKKSIGRWRSANL